MFQWKDTMRVQVTPLHRYSHKRLMSQRVVKPQPREHLGARGSSSKRCGAELPHWQWTYWTRTLGKRVVETTPISSDIPYIAMAICVTMCHMSRIPLVSLSVSIGFFSFDPYPSTTSMGSFSQDRCWWMWWHHRSMWRIAFWPSAGRLILFGYVGMQQGRTPSCNQGEGILDGPHFWQGNGVRQTLVCWCSNISQWRWVVVVPIFASSRCRCHVEIAHVSRSQRHRAASKISHGRGRVAFFTTPWSRGIAISPATR